MGEKRLSKKLTFESHELLIIPKVVSKSKKYFKIFRPKEIIALEPCDFSFKIKNIGKKDFPGGRILKVHIRYHTGEKTSLNYHRNIPKIPVGNSYTTLKGEKVIINTGTVWFLAVMNSKDGEKISYYQKDKATGKNNYIDDKVWADFIYVYSKQEILQRYTNYILIVLTFITTLLFIVNLILLLR